jgi:hypothetical protein
MGRKIRIRKASPKRKRRIKINRQRGKFKKQSPRRIKIRRTTRSKKVPSKSQGTRRKKLRLFRKPKLPADPRIARGLGLMRREGISASKAAGLERMKLATFRKGAGRFLYRSGPGKPWKARDEDQLSFSMEVLTRHGRISVIIRNSRERRLLHDYENALRMFRGAEDGAEAALKKFEGKAVGGYELITNTKLLIELEEAGHLDFENLYSSFGGRS